ncbi:hypothetical protein GTQ40_10500 [Flavobacteriaceae bacterium R38]|nr:hypothetical protein [Flavobacteriaceae bacterium R38]
MTISEYTVNILKTHGVKKVFCTPGGAIYPIIHELIKNGIELIDLHHEQALVHAAEGYSYNSDNLSVVLVTSGPGITNTITAIANAHNDRNRLLLICGHVPVNKEFKQFQELNALPLFNSITKYCAIVSSKKEFKDKLNRAMTSINLHPYGPVAIFIKESLWHNTISSTVNRSKKNEKEQTLDLSEFTKELISHDSPLIIIGNGLNSSQGKRFIKELIVKYNFPFASTFKALNILSYENDNYLGIVGYCGSERANYALKECDFLLFLGVNLNNRIVNQSNLKSKKIYCVSLDKKFKPREKIDIKYINSNVIDFLKEFIKRSEKINIRSNWWKSIRKRKTLFEEKTFLKYSQIYSPVSILMLLKQLITRESIVVTDCGQHQLWVAQIFDDIEFSLFFTPGTFGVMGSSLASAIGIALANPHSTIFCIIGDGGLYSSLHCLKTIAEKNLNIKIILMNNESYGLVRQNQEYNKLDTSSSQLHSNINIWQVAKSLGLQTTHFDNLPSITELSKAIETTQFLEFRFLGKFDVRISRT